MTPLPARSRRWVPVAAGVLAGAAAAAAVAVAVLPDTPAGAPVLAVRQVTTAPGVTATAGLVDHTWGVELRLVATGLPAGRAYDVRIVDDGGEEHDSGAFLGVDRTITCSMNASVLLADAARFEVVDPAGPSSSAARSPPEQGRRVCPQRTRNTHGARPRWTPRYEASSGDRTARESGGSASSRRD